MSRKIVRFGIGSSDACLIHGVESFGRTAFDLWVENRKGGIELDEEEHAKEAGFRMELGNRLEPSIMQRLRDKLTDGHKFYPGPDLFSEPLKHPEHTFITDRPDGVLVKQDEVIILEGKVLTVHHKSKSVSGNQEVPENYYYQGLHHVAVIQRLYPGRKVRLVYGFDDLVRFEDSDIEVELDQSEVDAHLARCVEWWNEHIVNGVTPPVDGGSDNAAEAFKGVSGSREATPAEDELLQSLRALKELEKQLEDRKKEVEGELRKSILDSGVDKVYSETGSYSYTERNGRTSFDKKAFDESYPGVYAKFAKAGSPYRQALFTPKKEKK